MRMSKALPAVSVGWSSHILGDGGAWKKIPTEAKATGSNCVGLEASLADTRNHYPGGTTVVYCLSAYSATSKTSLMLPFVCLRWRDPSFEGGTNKLHLPGWSRAPHFFRCIAHLMSLRAPQASRAAPLLFNDRLGIPLMEAGCQATQP
jgi:hypothetical protein